jgi:hypothetical protein
MNTNMRDALFFPRRSLLLRAERESIARTKEKSKEMPIDGETIKAGYHEASGWKGETG